jgi:hypothetical protein
MLWPLADIAVYAFMRVLKAVRLQRVYAIGARSL